MVAWGYCCCNYIRLDQVETVGQILSPPLLFKYTNTPSSVALHCIPKKKLSYSQFLLLLSGSLLATSLEQHQYVLQIPYSA